MSLWIKIKQRIWKHASIMPLIAYTLNDRRGTVTAHFRQESRYPGKVIYKALILHIHGKQLFLKRDGS